MLVGEKYAFKTARYESCPLGPSGSRMVSSKLTPANLI